MCHNNKDKKSCQCWDREKLIGKLLRPPPTRRVEYYYPFPKMITVCYYFVHHNFSSHTMYTSIKCLVRLVLPCNLLLPCFFFFQDKLSYASSGFAYDIICRRTSCHITSILSFIDLASAAGILRIFKLGVMKLRGSG